MCGLFPNNRFCKKLTLQEVYYTIVFFSYPVKKKPDHPKVVRRLPEYVWQMLDLPPQ
jgi:hypothetical protein